MALLSIDSKKRNYKFIGGYLPTWLHEYLALYTVAKRCSSTSVLRTILEDWAKKVRQEENNDQLLITMISKRLQEQWNEGRSETRNAERSFDRFKKLAEEELTKKGIKPSYIKLILVEIKP